MRSDAARILPPRSPSPNPPELTTDLDAARRVLAVVDPTNTTMRSVPLTREKLRSHIRSTTNHA